MKKLLDLPVFDTLAQISSIEAGKTLTVETVMRHFMFMEEVARELEFTQSTTMSLTKIEEFAKEHSGCDELSLDQLGVYTRLASLTYRLLLPWAAPASTFVQPT